MNRPQIVVSLDRPGSRYLPGEVLIAEYKIDLPSETVVSAVESSVIWLTIGKGDEDCGVHFFERRPKQTLNSAQLRRPHRISSVLPPSPLSYDGEIVKIRWCVRIRAFFDEQQKTEDAFFQLGNSSTCEYEKIDGGTN